MITAPKYHGVTRRATVAGVVLCALAIGAPRVGERDRSKEPDAIGTIRDIVMAESVFSSIFGYYETLDCLAAPSCVSGVTGGFLDPELAKASERHGYRFQFHAGPRADVERGRRVSASAMTGFAVVAAPVGAAKIVRRSFCGDATGSIYATTDGSVPRVEEGRCVDTTNPLR